MKFTTSVSLGLSLLPLIAADSVSFDPVYDNANQSLATVSCSNGANGLLTRGFTTFGSLPNLAHIGGATAVEGFNSVNCGTCWQLTFTNSSGIAKSVNSSTLRCRR
ncbi:Cerato-platanin-domain-containing protein [Infundibulicybe gibba]|nr:Cerato-platanin-domain-containing protein [Infundibulicybe gibba]